MDKEADDTVRTRVLARLSRIGSPPGEEFEALLYLPFRSHDEYAAAVLALTGRPIAPSLVVAGLKRCGWPDEERHDLLARAAIAIAPADGEVVALAGMRLKGIESYEWSGLDRPYRQEIMAEVGAALERWLGAHPEARQSRFEQERRAYEESPRRRREREVEGAPALEDLSEEEIDFGVAALRITEDLTGVRDRGAEALDRLATLCRRETAGIESPREKLAVLHRRLLPRHQRYSAGFERGPPSTLARVFRDGAGNCVGWTSLYVALGERLELPLRAMAMPAHVFLRYDDGATRFDVELTAGGRIRTPADLGGAVPRPLTKKGLLSVVLANLASARLRGLGYPEGDPLPQALDLADRALRFDPENAGAHLNRAAVLVRIEPTDPEPALREIARAEALAPRDPNVFFMGAKVMLAAGRPEAARGWLDRVVPTKPGEALDPEVRGQRYGLLVATGDPRWRDEFEAIAASPPASWMLVLDTAEILLGPHRGRPEDAEEALELLARLDDLKAEARRRPASDGLPAPLILRIRNRALDLRTRAREKLDR
jgi:hypothetical protein